MCPLCADTTGFSAEPRGKYSHGAFPHRFLSRPLFQRRPQLFQRPLFNAGYIAAADASVGFHPGAYDEYARKYDPNKMHYGFNTIDGEEVFYIPNPALGLWIDRQRMSE